MDRRKWYVTATEFADSLLKDTAGTAMSSCPGYPKWLVDCIATKCFFSDRDRRMQFAIICKDGEMSLIARPATDGQKAFVLFYDVDTKEIEFKLI